MFSLFPDDEEALSGVRGPLACLVEEDLNGDFLCSRDCCDGGLMITFVLAGWRAFL